MWIHVDFDIQFAMCLCVLVLLIVLIAHRRQKSLLRGAIGFGSVLPRPCCRFRPCSPSWLPPAVAPPRWSWSIREHVSLLKAACQSRFVRPPRIRDRLAERHQVVILIY